MTINIKKDAWNRDGTFIKLIVDLIQNKASDGDIIKLVGVARQDYDFKDLKLSESDIFLLYCKLIEAKRSSVVKELRLIEDLVEFEGEYTYETTYRDNPHDKTIKFPLLAYCVYNQVDWKDIAFIQQQKNINNATSMKIELQKEHWKEQLIKESLLDSHQGFQKYKPYLMMGDVYVDFVAGKDDYWSDKLRNAYRLFPEQAEEYLEYMAEHFHLTLALQTTLAGDEVEAEEISKSTKDWLATYAKALRNMVETVIKEIKDKRSLTQDSKRQALCKISQSVLAHLDACDKTVLKVLDDKDKDEKDQKPRNKLTDFIEDLRENVKKISSTYSAASLFNLSTTATENQPSEIDQIKLNP
ncbi:MAG: hypothetical protein RJA83_619 [Pseudomonadota bacterium]|jgi:hypothetical protein